MLRLAPVHGVTIVPRTVRRAVGILLLAVAPAAAQVAQRVPAGAAVFGEKGCASCHAVDGVGGGVGPDLGRAAAPASLFALGAAMWNHLPAMAARMRQDDRRPPRLAPWEAADLVAFLFAIRYYNPPGDARLGEAVFTGKGCVRCHQVRGAGGAIGPPLDGVAERWSPIELAAAMWNHAPGMERAMETRGLVRPTLTGAELGHLRAFLGAGAAAPAGAAPLHVLPGRDEVGRRLFREKRCGVCHRPGGGGPDLAGAPRRDLSDFAAAMWNKAPRMLEAARRRGLQLPRLESDEMADLVAYLGTLQYVAGEGAPARGAARLEDLGCTACHAPGARAVNLRRVRGTATRAAVLAGLWNHVTLADSVAPGEWPTLSAAAVADLAAYFETWGNEP